MTLMFTAGAAWMLLSFPVAVVLGRGIRLADEAAEAPFRTDDIERFLRDQVAAPLS